MTKCKTIKQPPLHPVILKCTQSIDYEDVVRLAFHVSLYCSMTDRPNCFQFALSLLASLFTFRFTKIGPGVLSDKTNRAVNCLLIYLSSIKAEKDSQDWIYIQSIKNNPDVWDRHLACYLQLIHEFIRHYGPQLIPSVCNCLTLLLSKSQKQQNLSPNLSPVKQSVSNLRGDVIRALEQQLMGLKC